MEYGYEIQWAKEKLNFIFRFLWPCIVSKVWGQKNQQDATIRCLLLTSVSTCIGHHYAHLQENKHRVTAYGVLRSKRTPNLVEIYWSPEPQISIWNAYPFSYPRNIWSVQYQLSKICWTLVSIVITLGQNIIILCQILHKNPYHSH